MEFRSLVVRDDIIFSSDVVLSRLQEKATLSSINERFAKFKDKVKSLQCCNERLETKIKDLEKIEPLQTTLHLQEQLRVLQKKLEEAIKEKTKKQLELQKCFKLLESYLKKINRESSDKVQAQDCSKILREDINKADLKKLSLENEAEKINSQLTLLRSSFEIDYETMVKKLLDLSISNDSETQQQANETIKSLHEIRKSFEFYKDNEINKIVNFNKAKKKDISIRIEKLKESNRAMFLKIRKLNQHLRASTVDMQAMSTRNSYLKRRLDEIENRHEKELEVYEEKIINLKQRLQEAKDEELYQRKKFSNLFSNKQQLNSELENYHKLLEDLSKRLLLICHSQKASIDTTKLCNYGMKYHYYSLYPSDDAFHNEIFTPLNAGSGRKDETAISFNSARVLHCADNYLKGRFSESWSMDESGIDSVVDDLLM